MLGQGDFRLAADLFAAVAKTHAGGPLTAEALFLRGAALDSAGDLEGAGAAWLESFAANPNGPQAPDALLGLSRAEATTGDAKNGCPFLLEISVRFPDAPQASEAAKRLEAVGCEVFDPADIVIDDSMTDPAATGTDMQAEDMTDPEAAFDEADMLDFGDSVQDHPRRMSDLLRARVEAELDRLAGDFGRIGIAFSGGGDSAALLHLAARWRQGRVVMAATVDHGLRPDRLPRRRRRATRPAHWACPTAFCIGSAGRKTAPISWLRPAMRGCAFGGLGARTCARGRFARPYAR
ncbi:ATP-binding protein [Paracoccus cavernae]|uniref:ATP-binding protein n=1 Tax=Paracoccus cavernae TaxID=1571207 RepID=UPI00363AEF09